MKLNPLSFTQKDFLSLKFYLYNNYDDNDENEDRDTHDNESQVVTEIRHHLLIKMHHLNNEIADHFYEQEITNQFDYIKKENGDYDKIETLSDLFVKGICNGLADEFLEFGPNKRLYVKEEKFLEWQNLIANMSPAFLIAAFFASDKEEKEIEYKTDLSIENIRAVFSDYILPNCKYTTLLSPEIKPVKDLFGTNNGLNDLHIHLNGVTEMDGVWQNLLYERDTNLLEITKKISEDSCKQQLEQINIFDKNDISSIKFLLDRALIIRDDFFDLIFGKTVHKNKNADLISGKHPFRNLFTDSDLEIFLPNKEIRYEVLMFYVVLMNIRKGIASEKLSSLLHEYLLIYGFFSEILIHNQEEFGFEQFQNITKNNFREKVDDFQLNKFYQLSGNDINFFNFIEFRFSPKEDIDKQVELLNKIDADWNKFLANKNDSSQSDLKNTDYKLIAHFIKKIDKYQNNNKSEDSIENDIRYYELRTELEKKCEKLISTISIFGEKNRITAVDAAASEFDTPPEVFAPVFRKLREANAVRHFTYHAGEDFYHILDGLRAIYEAIIFLNLQHGDRIGHASACGTDVDTWADILMKKITMPQGVYLDDLIFVHCFIIEQKIESLYAKLPMIEIKIYEIARKIYNKTYGMEDLISAWKKHYLDPRYIKENNTNKTLFGEADDKYKSVDKTDFEIISLYNRKETYKKYRQPIEVECFECFNANELTLLQKSMLAFMHKREIVIEALPTSNLRIGYHRNLKSYQLFNWHKWKLDGNSIPPIVLGTDDPGIFQTNIYNEYAMIYCYLVYEKGLTRSDVIKFMQDIHDASRVYAFR